MKKVNTKEIGRQSFLFRQGNDSIENHYAEDKMNYIRKEVDRLFNLVDAWEYFDEIKFDFTNDQRRR